MRRDFRLNRANRYLLRMDRCGGLCCERRGAASTPTPYGIIKPSEACWSTLSRERRRVRALMSSLSLPYRTSVLYYLPTYCIVRLAALIVLHIDELLMIIRRSIHKLPIVVATAPHCLQRVHALYFVYHIGSFIHAFPFLIPYSTLDHVLKQYQGHLSVRYPASASLSISI